MIWEDMHLQVNTLFDLGLEVTQNVAQYPLHHAAYSGSTFAATTSNGLGGDALTKIHFLTVDLNLWVNVTRNVAQYHLHHVSYQIQSFKLLRLTI